ncbi:MAG: 2TM domain-containing protein, partial [Pseudomonadota bacterium]
IKKRRDASLAFWIHLVTYIGVIALLFAINLNSKREGLWVVWPAIGWGVGVFAHGATVLLTNRLSNDEKEIGNFDL